MVFTATTNTLGENGDKKQNTLPYPLQFKVVEVCLVGAGERGHSLHTSTGIKTHHFTHFSGISGYFWIFFYAFPDRL